MRVNADSEPPLPVYVELPLGESLPMSVQVQLVGHPAVSLRTWPDATVRLSVGTKRERLADQPLIASFSV